MIRKAVTMMSSFLESEAAGGLILMAAAAAAMIVANSPLSHDYFELLHHSVAVEIFDRKLIEMSLSHWINDALMAIFFLMVGLEIKREVMTGELSTWSRRALPGIAAAGGVIVPALIYVAINWSSPESIRGWAIPTATDIAFALGVLALLGSRVPVALKIFLTALAIIDDLAAVIVIAVFYTADLNLMMLGAALLGLGVLLLLNLFRVKAVWIYLAVGVVIWYFVYKSGVHATLAGVALAMFIPLHTHKGEDKNGGDDHHSPLIRLEHFLHKPVAFLVVPIFGFANAGVSLAGFTPDLVLETIPLGVLLGLFVGKQVGVFAASFFAIKSGLAPMPENTTWAQLYGLSILTGIGFTMSLFIGLLAFPNAQLLQDEVKVGVLLGSILSGVVGFILLRNLKPAPAKA